MRGERLAGERHLAAHARLGAEDEPRELGAARADKTRDAEHFARVQIEAAAAHARAVRDVAHRQQQVARIVGRVRFLVEARNIAADHHADEPLGRQRVALERADVRAVAQHRDAVGQLVDLRHPVADVDDREPFGAQLADQPEQVIGFARRQRRRRFVHHEDARPGVNGARDLDELLLGDRQRADERVRPEIRAEPLEHVLTAARHRGAVDRAPAAVAAAQLAADMDVLRDAQVRREAELLIDHRDARFARGERPVDRDRPAVDQDLATGIGLIRARQDLHERRLARAVLAHQRMDLARVDGEAHAGERAHGRERLADAAHLEQRAGRIRTLHIGPPANPRPRREECRRAARS